MPHLTYCNLVWNFCKSSDRRKIECIQERALRAVFKTSTETYEELLKRAKLPTLHNRRLQDIAILMYKVKNDLVPSYISEIFTRNVTRYNLIPQGFCKHADAKMKLDNQFAKKCNSFSCLSALRAFFQNGQF